MDVAHAHYTTIVKENEIKLNEQRHSKHGSAFHKLRGFMKPTGWKPLTILFLFFSFQQFSGIYITLFYAVTWFQVSQTRHHRRSRPSAFCLDTYFTMIVSISGSRLRRRPVHSLDPSWCNAFLMLDGEHLASKTI